MTFSARALGRLLEPDAPERGRRNVLRYLNTGISPRKEMRARIAKALGITRRRCQWMTPRRTSDHPHRARDHVDGA
ncbi:MAG: hypothetical protein M5T61_21635 [Acidimicrobiia bacterium]|nr:hypothetical protein [Acidimicrobiia bacterium]